MFSWNIFFIALFSFPQTLTDPFHLPTIQLCILSLCVSKVENQKNKEKENQN